MDSGPTAVLASSGEELTEADPAGVLRRAGRAAGRAARDAEVWLVLVLAALTLAVHDLSAILARPFWTDEAWVAVTARFPLSDLPSVASSTPFGWALLIRLFDDPGHQTMRLLPLGFAMLTVAAAYVLGRNLGWRDRRVAIGAGVLCAVGALTVPAMVGREDLKQYTADAFVAVCLMVALSALEREWTRRRLGALAAIAAVGMLLSHTTAFVAAAVLGAVFLTQLVRRAWPRLAEITVTGLAAGIGMGIVYEVFDARAVIPGLTGYWDAFYVPFGKGFSASAHFLREHLHATTPFVGLGPSWLLILLCLLGVVALTRIERPITALAFVLLAPIMVVVSGLKKYPLLDLRTSTFLIVLMIMLAAVAVAWLCSLAAEAAAPLWRPRNLAAVAVGLAAAALFANNVSSTFRTNNSLPNEDVRTQALYVHKHLTANDIVVVNMNASWGFAYYWPQGTPAIRKTDGNLQSYVPVFPDQRQVVVADSRTADGVIPALDEAFQWQRQHPGGHIYLVRSHVNRVEGFIWGTDIKNHGMIASWIGHSGLSVLTPLPPPTK